MESMDNVHCKNQVIMEKVLKKEFMYLHLKLAEKNPTKSAIHLGIKEK